MTKSLSTWLQELKDFTTEHGLEVELGLMRELFADGVDLRQVSFMMRDRYPMPALAALRAECLAVEARGEAVVIR